MSAKVVRVRPPYSTVVCVWHRAVQAGSGCTTYRDGDGTPAITWSSSGAGGCTGPHRHRFASVTLFLSLTVRRQYNNCTIMSDLKSKLLQVYSVLKSELLHDPAFDFTPESRQWLDHMLDYNVPKGKLNRLMCVVDCFKELKEGKELSDDEFFLASALGWCIEWFQAAALIVDDIMDNSHMRRGQPCWFRLPKVGMIALNDAIILRNQIARILKMHFRDKPYYVDLLDLFNEVEFQTFCGQMIDLITASGKDLSNYSLELYYKIAEYKGAYYSLYLPVACSLLLAGENLDNHHDLKKPLIEIAAAYQIQDDFLDCFGDPKLTGKVGTDIEEGKCSWLIVKALECANDEQKQLLYENYGKADPTCAAKVKELYENLHIPEIYAEYEEKIFEELILSVAAHPSKLVKALWRRYATRR